MPITIVETSHALLDRRLIGYLAIQPDGEEVRVGEAIEVFERKDDILQLLEGRKLQLAAIRAITYGSIMWGRGTFGCKSYFLHAEPLARFRNAICADHRYVIPPLYRDETPEGAVLETETATLHQEIGTGAPSTEGVVVGYTIRLPNGEVLDNPWRWLLFGTEEECRLLCQTSGIDGVTVPMTYGQYSRHSPQPKVDRLVLDRLKSLREHELRFQGIRERTAKWANPAP